MSLTDHLWVFTKLQVQCRQESIPVGGVDGAVASEMMRGWFPVQGAGGRGGRTNHTVKSKLNKFEQYPRWDGVQTVW